MFFGEIVEPSTRALIDEEEYPEYTPPTFEWSGDKQPLSKAESLIFIETKRIEDIFQKFILRDLKPLCSLNKNIIVYQKSKHFIILYKELFFGKNESTTGEIVKELAPYITKAKEIYTITSSSLHTYQGEIDRDQVECLFKSIFTKKSNAFNCAKLGSPNFITGLGADILSYCIYKKLECSSFILYHKNTDIDTMSSRPVLDLAEKLALSPSQHYFRAEVPSSNLYM